MKINTYLAVLAISISASTFAQDIKLPEPSKIGGMPLMEALNKRRSNRSFSAKSLDKNLVSNLLWSAFGINNPDGKRTAPSALNRQEIDVYAVTESGVYLYAPKENILKLVVKKDIREFTGKQPFTSKVPVNLIFVSDNSKIESNDVFYSAIDTGYISQNVYLYCASEGLSTVAVAWFDHDPLHQAMNLKSNQKIILTQPVGWPEEPEVEEETSNDSLTYKDGTYSGEAKGYKGPVQVMLIIKDGKITSVEVTKQNESLVLTTLKDIPERIVSSQSADVDAITGATITSKAIMNAVKDALRKASK